jgi:hypothetical protein
MKIEVSMNSTAAQPMNRRALTSMFMFFAFILLPLSGIPLHFSRTEGDVGMTEHYLMSVHNVSALIFFIAVAVHLTLNWSALTKYIAAKTGEYFRFRKEMIIALITVLLVVGLFSSHALHSH